MLPSATGFDFISPGIVSPCTSTAVTYHGGLIITAAPVQFIFCGPTWQTLLDPMSPGQLLFDTFTAAVKIILATPYISGLRQYEVRRWSLGTSRIFASSSPALLPNTISEYDVQQVVQSLIDDDTFPEPDEPGGSNLYFVMLPPNTQMSPAGNRGAHSNFNTDSIIDVDIAWYVWIGSQSLSGMTSTFSHELVDMCTDPDGDGWRINGVSKECVEISDLCNAVDGPLGVVNTQSYWSIFDGACIIPTAWSVKRTLAAAGKKLGGKGLRSLQDPILSMNQFIVSL
jgi:hypothetical protein